MTQLTSRQLTPGQPTTGQLTTGQCATLACLWEVSIPKPGNVHRGADYEDLTFYDFANSAVAIAPAMEAAANRGIGQTILDAVMATQQSVGTNTNLGTILLMAPLAAAKNTSEAASNRAAQDGTAASTSLQDAAAAVLQNLTAADTTLTYQAIRAANPGGMGEVDDMDVATDAPTSLLEAMRAAEDRDLVARQYSNGFAQIFDLAVPSIEAGLAAGWSLPQSVIHTHLNLMAEWPDSLIARKCGKEVARDAATRARTALDAGEPNENNYQQAVADLDFWLRSDGHRRNPGTTADLIAVSLFVMLLQGTLTPSAMSTAATMKPEASATQDASGGQD